MVPRSRASGLALSCLPRGPARALPPASAGRQRARGCQRRGRKRQAAMPRELDEPSILESTQIVRVQELCRLLAHSRTSMLPPRIVRSCTCSLRLIR